MDILILCLYAVIGASCAADIDLSTKPCGSTATLPDKSGTITISNTAAATCDWKLGFNQQYRIKLESQLLCLSCSEVLKIKDSSFAVIWDVDTAHQDNGGAAGEKVCTKQSLYCSTGGTKEIREDNSPLTLQYEKHGTETVNIKFAYELFDKPPQVTVVGSASNPQTASDHSTTPSSAGKIGLSLASLLCVAYLFMI